VIVQPNTERTENQSDIEIGRHEFKGIELPALRSEY
jgi:hypothetical protein